MLRKIKPNTTVIVFARKGLFSLVQKQSRLHKERGLKGAKMRILVVSQFFFPDTFIINDIVKTLCEKGHEVFVLTGLPDYATGRVPAAYRRGKRRNECLFGAKVHRVGMIERREGMLRRMMNYLSFMVNAAVYMLFERRWTYDVIFAYETSPIFQVLAAIIAKKRTGRRLVLYCCDLWPESLKAWGVREESLVFRIVKRFSAWVYRKCDTVLISSGSFGEYLSEKLGVQQEKIVYLPQYTQDVFSKAAGKYIENDYVDFVFAGNVGSVQAVDVILRALSHIETNKAYMVHIVGDGSALAQNKALAEELAVSKHVKFHGRHALDEMKRFYLLADCFLLTLKAEGPISLTLPSKTQSYMSAAKPIVASIGGSAKEILLACRGGLVSEPGDVLGLAENMQKVIENHAYYKPFGERAGEYYRRHFTKERFFSKLLENLQPDKGETK